MKQTILNILDASAEVKNEIRKDDAMIETIRSCTEAFLAAFIKGNKILFCGNGGSAADAQHLAAEFTGRFYKDRRALPAEALHVNTSYLTAVANDYGFENVYSRMIAGIGIPGDVLVALSTSGNSPNILNAITAAKEKNMFTIGFTGRSGGKMKEMCDLLIAVPSEDTPRIQECHIMIGHIICQLTEQEYFAENNTGRKSDIAS